MAKEDVVSIVVYALILAFAAVLGFSFLVPKVEAGLFGDQGRTIIFMVLSLLVGLILNALLFEVAHLIGAKIGKYEVLSFNVLGFAIYKRLDADKKSYLSVKFPRNYDGLVGETIISPKSEKSYPIPYVFSPLIVFLIEVLGVILFFYYVPDANSTKDILITLKYGLFIVMAVCGMMIIYDYFPAKLDNMNDGYRLVMLNKKINIEAFNELLRYERDQYFGEETVTIKTFDQITDFTAKVNLVSIQNKMANNSEEALADLEKLLESEKQISKETLLTVKTLKMFILFMYKSIDEGKAFAEENLKDDLKKFIFSRNSILTAKTYALYVHFVEKSESETQNALERCDKLLNKINLSQLKFETNSLNEVKNKIKQEVVEE